MYWKSDPGYVYYHVVQSSARRLPRQVPDYIGVELEENTRIGQTMAQNVLYLWVVRHGYMPYNNNHTSHYSVPPHAQRQGLYPDKMQKHCTQTMPKTNTLPHESASRGSAIYGSTVTLTIGPLL
jgi:hypothetical protein